MRILAVIPARGGSKGIPGKNIISVGGIPLIVWTIEAALSSTVITKTMVSSDDDEILEIAKRYGAETLKRPDVLASDTAGSEGLVLHALEVEREQGNVYDYVMLLQPTSPLRTAEDIDAALTQLKNSHVKALISVYTPEHTPYKAFKLNSKGMLEGLVDNKTPFMRRQDLPQTFMPNGAIYLVEVAHFEKKKSFFCEESTIAYEMSREKSLDIDTMEDLKKVETVLIAD